MHKIVPEIVPLYGTHVCRNTTMASFAKSGMQTQGPTSRMISHITASRTCADDGTGQDAEAAAAR